MLFQSTGARRCGQARVCLFVPATVLVPAVRDSTGAGGITDVRFAISPLAAGSETRGLPEFPSAQGASPIACVLSARSPRQDRRRAVRIPDRLARSEKRSWSESRPGAVAAPLRAPPFLAWQCPVPQPAAPAL